ncbi:sigma-70 family RNA polymerase sigma factor [Flavimobilis sp. GY10621]|uniref:Sigma-70 family RNA polymerase sigma factor n=1 Tax=Flavimobilis rhizosphaerae TaxID=2775421 RepID=A0ABR9DPN7_9MICO|nr:sigma-70 family RNA polymerase sigma factor [Flavimobilis rhizosphaerae]MBD9699078.1 sigma-70 family RNA polymerase sigma factor [Flavimobilis rhizosphaerae]
MSTTDAALPPFTEIVARHGATVWRVCRAVVGADAADDAWSETFLAALRAYPDLPPTTNLEAWLVTVAHRRAVDVVRRERRTVPAGTDPSDLAAPARHDAPDPAVRAADTEVWTRVAALPERQRLALAYHHLGGLTYVEVAALVGGTSDAVRRAAADGLATLRRTYGSEEIA